MASTLSQIRAVRLGKVKKLREIGIDPYPSKSDRTHKIGEVLQNFDLLIEKKVTIVGRIMLLRVYGSLMFYQIEDFFGRIQIIVKKDIVKELDLKKQILGWKELNLLDIGDFIQVSGKVTKSKTGEKSVEAQEVKILSKAIRPLPDKWEGIKDKETRLRRRYLDLAMSSSTRDLFLKKSIFWEASLEFMNKNGFIMVQTPVIEETTGGADAKPFITHHNALNEDFYLRISPELYLKRLIGGGFDKIYEFGPVFRNEGIDDEHAQDYWHLEYYWAYADYKKSMDFVKNLIMYSAEKAFKTLKFKTRGYQFDLSKKWEIIDYVKIIKERFDVDIFSTPNEVIFEKIKKAGVKIDFDKNRNRLIDNLWKIIRKDIAGPAFLVNEPKFMSPLAKSKRSDERLTERFHVIIAGTENGNGYSEINDPVDQLERFKEQEKLREKGDDEAQMMDYDFVEMLEYGMPPCSGYGHSERLFWFLANTTAREGIIFPLNKKYIEETTKEIYGIRDVNLNCKEKVQKL